MRTKIEVALSKWMDGWMDGWIVTVLGNGITYFFLVLGKITTSTLNSSRKMY